MKNEKNEKVMVEPDASGWLVVRYTSGLQVIDSVTVKTRDQARVVQRKACQRGVGLIDAAQEAGVPLVTPKAAAEG